MQSFVEGETLAREFTLFADEGVVQNLTGCTVELLLTGADGTPVTVLGTLTIRIPATEGVVRYTPATTDLSGHNSPFAASFRITDSEGRVGYYPGDGADSWFVYPPRTAFPRFTFADLRKQVMRWLDALDDYNQGTGVDELVKQQLNEAALARASQYPWPFMKGTYRVTIGFGQRRYTLPGNIGRLLYVWSPTHRRFCTRVPDRHLDDLNLDPTGTSGSGLFMPYEMQGNSLVFYEDPPAAEDLQIGFFRTPSKLLNDTDIPDLPYPHSRLLVWDALLDLKTYARESEASSLWMAKQQAAEHALWQAFVEGQTIGEAPLRIKDGR
jgi:hypothetical protein